MLAAREELTTAAKTEDQNYDMSVVTVGSYRVGGGPWSLVGGEVETNGHMTAPHTHTHVWLHCSCS